MPPKSSQKRSRESPSTGTTAASASGSTSAATPGPAPLLRRGRSGSVTSQDEANGSDGAPRLKRGKRDRATAEASDMSLDEGDEEEEGENGAARYGGGTNGTAAASLSEPAAAKKRSRRKSSTAAAAAADKQAGSATGSSATQPPIKRVRKSTGSAASGGISKTATPNAFNSTVTPTPAAGPTSEPHQGAAGAVPPTPPTTNGRHLPAPATTTQPAAAVVAAAAPSVGRGGLAAGTGRPPLPASAPRAGGSGPGAVGGGGVRRSSGVAASRGGSTGARESAGKRSPPAVVGTRNVIGNGVTTAAAGAVVAAPRSAAVRGSPVAAAAAAAALDNSSPVRGVSPSRLRRIAGSAEDSPVDTAGHRSEMRLRGVEADVGVGGDGGGSGRGWQAAARKGRAWAVQLGGRLPEVEPRKVLPLVQNLSMRCLLLLLVLLGARGIWAATVAATGGLRAGLDGERTPVVVPRREAALSLVRESEEFQSLEGVMAGRRRHLSELEELDGEGRARLDGLADLTASVEGKIELLREQVPTAAAVAAAGQPDGRNKPQDASGIVSSAQLEHVERMRTELLTAMETTGLVVDEGMTCADNDMKELEALRSATDGEGAGEGSGPAGEVTKLANEEWEKSFLKPVEEAFHALDGVAAAVTRIDAKAARMPGKKELASFVRRVDKAKLASAAGDDGGELLGRVEAAVAKEVEQEWGIFSGTTHEGGAGSSDSQLLRTNEEASMLIAREVEFFTSGGVGMPDYASLIAGATVAYGPLEGGDSKETSVLTSPTMAKAVLPWADYMLHLLRIPNRVYAENADAALSASNSLGDCFAFLGGKGTLTVALAPSATPSPQVQQQQQQMLRKRKELEFPLKQRDVLAAATAAVTAGAPMSWSRRDSPPGFVKVTHVSIEHAATLAAPSAIKSAPREFRVLGWDSDPTTSATAPAEAAAAPFDSSGDLGESGLTRPYLLLDGAEFLAGGGAPSVQTFAVSDKSLKLAPPVGWVTLVVRSNHGGAWTCLYGLRVHGRPYVGGGGGGSGVGDKEG